VPTIMREDAPAPEGGRLSYAGWNPYASASSGSCAASCSARSTITWRREPYIPLRSPARGRDQWQAVDPRSVKPAPATGTNRQE
jgi:hypothetical protein